MKQFWLMLLVGVTLTALMVSCVTAPAEEAPEPPFVLTQLQANPPAVTPAPTIPNLQIKGRVMEITLESGVQKYFFVKWLDLPKFVKIRNGQEGDIFADPSMAQKIGKYRVVEVFPDLCRAIVTELSFKMGNSAMVAFETPDLSKQ